MAATPESHLEATDAAHEGRSQNRRLDIVILPAKFVIPDALGQQGA